MLQARVRQAPQQDLVDFLRRGRAEDVEGLIWSKFRISWSRRMWFTPGTGAGCRLSHF